MHNIKIYISKRCYDRLQKIHNINTSAYLLKNLQCCFVYKFEFINEYSSYIGETIDPMKKRCRGHISDSQCRPGERSFYKKINNDWSQVTLDILEIIF